VTQPTSWVSQLINRFSEEDEQRYLRPKPMQFQVERAPFDPTSFYRDIGKIRETSRGATQVLNQRLAAKRAEELARMQAIPQMGIQVGAPSASGMFPGQQKKGSYGSPLTGYRLTSGFGHRHAPTRGASTFHRGVDLAAPQGTPIYATHSGVVSSSGWGSGYGYNITINGGGGIQSFYGHNSRNVVRAGQQVRRGQLIGYVGSTGVSTGPHLHYGVKINGQWVNPSGYY
jgi:murein DD-endopeptidase MepM/ murein hydrolase activator NlpD